MYDVNILRYMHSIKFQFFNNQYEHKKNKTTEEERNIYSKYCNMK